MPTESSKTAGKTPTLTIERVFDAPVELVWKAWSDPEIMTKWWGPKNFTSPSCKMDFRVGGKYLFCMRGAPGPNMHVKDFWSTGVYKEIVPMAKIVCTDCFADEQGNIVPASYYQMPGDNWPLEMLVTVTLEKTDGNKTKLTLIHAGHPAGQMSDMATQGWNQSFDKLEISIK